MKQLDEAILAALQADATVAAAPGGVWKRRAPQETGFPLVVFQPQAGTPSYALAERVYTEFVYVVKAIEAGDDNTAAADLDAAIDRVLSDNALEHVVLADAAGVIISSRRERDVEYEEQDAPGVHYQHVGGSYRVVVSRVG